MSTQCRDHKHFVKTCYYCCLYRLYDWDSISLAISIGVWIYLITVFRTLGQNVLSVGVETVGRESDQWLTYNTEVKNTCPFCADASSLPFYLCCCWWCRSCPWNETMSLNCGNLRAYFSVIIPATLSSRKAEETARNKWWILFYEVSFFILRLDF
jgi:hypothetical protein